MSGSVGIAGDRLRSFVERIERLEEETKKLSEDKKDVYATAQPSASGKDRLNAG